MSAQKIIQHMNKLFSLLAIVVTLQATAYCHTGNPTASGVMPQVGHCAVDKINGQWVPFGTMVRIKGLGTYKVTDRFGDGRNNCVDLFMGSYKKCVEFGRQDLEAEVELP